MPIESRTPEGLNHFFVSVFHDCLCENNFTFEKLIEGSLNSFRNIYMEPDAQIVTGGIFVFNTPNVADFFENQFIKVNFCLSMLKLLVLNSQNLSSK